MSLVPHGLYAITDPELLPGPRLFSAVEAALRGGAVLIQYRDKKASPSVRRKRAATLLRLCHAYDRLLIINDDLALTLAIDADGVHLGQSDGDLAAARQALGPHKILGATCHSSMSFAQQAAAAGCSYLAFGRFFPSKTKQQAPPAPLQILSQARQLGRSVTAIGGLTLENTEAVVAAGADLVATVNGLFAADDVEARARQFCQLIQNTRSRLARTL